jgi:hypothetical protein
MDNDDHTNEVLSIAVHPSIHKYRFIEVEAIEKDIDIL